jgi:membrane-associated phospholipid phosphatase
MLGAGLTAWWLLIYGGADWLTARHTRRVRVHLDAELHIPLVPELVVAYLSIDLLFVLAPFILRDRRQLNALAAALAAVTLVAGLCFLLLPAELAFPADEGPGPDEPLGLLLTFARRVALHYNLAPSLHVALSSVCLAAYAGRAGPLGRVLLWTWAGIIAASTVLTHQHHLLDVVTGFALAWAGTHFIYRRWLKLAPQTHPASPSTGPGPPA